MDLLERIQSKPTHVKTQYAFLCALVITGSITVIWASTIPARFSDNTEKMNQVQKEEVGTGFLTNTKAQLGNILNSQSEPKDDGTGSDTTDLPAPPPEIETPPEGALGELTGVSTTSIMEQSNTIPASSTPTKPAGNNVILIGTTTAKLSE